MLRTIKTRTILITIISIIIALHVSNASFIFDKKKLPEDAKLNSTGLALKYGNRVQEYEVITEDGYILTLYRIPGKSKYPILLMHGFLDTSDTWLLRGKGSLGATLANDHFDIWLGNSRGNRYSRRHVRLDPDKDSSYWQFSFHQIGHYDIPAMIDKILKVTGAPKLTAIGHSQGTTVFYVLGCTRPEYNAKVNLMISLAPIAYFNYVRPPLSTLMESFSTLDEVYTSLNLMVTDVFNYNSVYTRFIRAFCLKSLINAEACLNFLFFRVAGYDPLEFEPSFLRVFLYHFPAGISWMDFLHYGQVRLRHEFAPYDYGAERNLIVYNSARPPPYNLSSVSMPIALLAGRNDYLSTVPDVDRLRHELPNVVDYTVNRRLLFNHFDDVWGKRMRDYLFPDIYRVLLRYNNA